MFARFGVAATRRFARSFSASATEEQAAFLKNAKKAFCFFGSVGGFGGLVGYSVNSFILSAVDPAAHIRDGPSNFDYQPPPGLDYTKPENQKYLLPSEYRTPSDGRTFALEKWCSAFARIGGVKESELPLARIEAVADLYQQASNLLHEGIVKTVLVHRTIMSLDDYNVWDAGMIAKMKNINSQIEVGEKQLQAEVERVLQSRQQAQAATFDQYLAGKNESEVRQVAHQLYSRLIYNMEHEKTPQQMRDEEVNLFIHQNVVLPEMAQRGIVVARGGGHH